MSPHNVQLAHELDAAWIIALWKAIHGGDPAPERIASQAIAALATVLVPRTAGPTPGTPRAFEARLKMLGLRLTIAKGDPAETEAVTIRRPAATGNGIFHCFHFADGEVICVEGGGDAAYVPRMSA